MTNILTKKKYYLHTKTNFIIKNKENESNNTFRVYLKNKIYKNI